MNSLIQTLTDYMMHLDDTEQGQAADLVRDAINEIERLQAQIAGYERWAQSVNEALNSGDGSYRP